MSNSNQICFYTESGDTNSFGSSVAINDKYMIVGDPNANRVIVYQRDSEDRWYRSRVIYPPENSVPYQVGSGFGQNLWLDGNALIIDATTIQPTENISNPDNFTFISSLNLVFIGKYFIRLDKEIEVTTINFPLEQKKGSSQFYILDKGNLKLITLPNNGEETFGAYIAVHKDLLLVGSPSNRTGGNGWLFNLKALDNLPIELTTDNAHLGDTVAISEQFAIVGHSGYKTYDIVADDILRPKTLYPKTLIKSLENSSTMGAGQTCKNINTMKQKENC